MFVLLMLITAWPIVGCGNSESTNEPAQTAVYFCNETKKPVIAAVQPTPAVNPATGRKTLVRALYCEKCKRWRPIPTDSAANGNPLATKCPKHRIPMKTEGPLPK